MHADPMQRLSLLFPFLLACSSAPTNPPPPPPSPPPPAAEAKPCASSEECPKGQHCSVEDGDCNRPPGCGPEDICPQVCYGVCVDDG